MKNPIQIKQTDDAEEEGDQPDDTEGSNTEECCINFIQEDGEIVAGRWGRCFNCQRVADAS